MGCLESGWGGGTGKEGREGGKEIPFGNKEKALNLQIPPTEAKPTPNQPQLGAQEPVNKCEGASQMTAPVLNAFTPRCCWASAPQLTRLSPPPPSSSPHSSLWLLNHLPLITPHVSKERSERGVQLELGSWLVPSLQLSHSGLGGSYRYPAGRGGWGVGGTSSLRNTAVVHPPDRDSSTQHLFSPQ